MQGSGIYKIINLIDGKFYIGSAKNFYNRFHIHKTHLLNKRHHSIYLQRAWDKYGSDAFEFHIIEVIENPTKELLETREQFYIDTLKPQYNIRKIAGSNLGIKRSEETRKKQSLLKLGKPGTRLGATVSQETRDKISAKLTGGKQSEETKHKKRIAAKGRFSNRKGQKLTAEQVERMKKPDKWPHPDGIKCKCRECLDKHATYHRERRLRIKNATGPDTNI